MSTVAVEERVSVEAKAKSVLEKLRDPHLRFLLAVFIAISTEETADVETALALTPISDGGDEDQVVESLFVLAKVQARQGRYAHAKEITQQRIGWMNDYWFAMARVHIFGHSHDKEDMNRAFDAVINIKSERLKKYAMASFERAKSNNYFRQLPSFDSSVISLISAAKELDRFSEQVRGTIKFTPEELRFQIDQIVSRVFWGIVRLS